MFDKMPSVGFPAYNFDLLNKENWNEDTDFTPEKVELFDRLKYIYFNSLKYITPEEVNYINQSPNLTRKDRVELRRLIQPGTILYEYNNLYYWSPILAQVNYNFTYGYIKEILSPTEIILKNPQNLELLEVDKSKIVFLILNDLEYEFIETVYLVKAIDKTRNKLTIEYLEGDYKVPISDNLLNAKVMESGGFIPLINEVNEITVVETDIKSLQTTIAQLTRAINEIDNVNDPSYIKSSRWRDYYRVKLATLFYNNNNLNSYYDTSGEPLPQWIHSVITSNKSQTLDKLNELAEEKRKLAESKVKSIDEWIEYLLQTSFYSFNFKIIVSFDSHHYESDRTFITATKTRFNSPFLSNLSRHIDSYTTNDSENSYYIKSSYTGNRGNHGDLRGIFTATIDISKILGITPELIKKYEINIASSLMLIRETNLLDYQGGENAASLKYYISIDKTNQPHIYNLRIELFAYAIYHGGMIGANITTVAKKIG